MTTDAVRAAIYARISLDSNGEELGVARQLDLGRELVASRPGWKLVGEFPDNSISALNGKHRPAYAALLAAVARGEIDRVVVYHLSRLWRNRRERAEGIEALKSARVSIASARGPDLDMETAYGRSMAGLLGEFDTMESEVKSERVKDHKRQYAESGRYHGGGTRPFGYALEYDRPAVNPTSGQRQARRVVGIRPHPEEAPVVRDAAARVLAGESLRSVARCLNERGLTTSAGKPWRPEGVRRMLCAAMISGRRELISRDVHKGRVRPVVGEIVATECNWPGIITAEQSDRLRAILSDPARRKSPTEARKTMLTGVLVCGRCDTPMVSRPRQGVPRYSCVSDPGQRGCGKTTVDGARTDARIRDVVLDALDSPELAERLRRPDGADPDLIDRIRADEERLELLAADYGAGEISRAEWKAARAAITPRLDGARAQLATSTRTTALDGFVGSFDEMRARWEEMNPSQRRAVVLAAVESVKVNQTEVRGRFDPDRFVPLWRAASGA